MYAFAIKSEWQPEWIKRQVLLDAVEETNAIQFEEHEFLEV